MKLQKTFEAFKTRYPPPGVSNVLNVFFIFRDMSHTPPPGQPNYTYLIYNI